MKNKLFTVALASAIAFALAFATSCEEKNEDEGTPKETPSLQVSPSAVNALQAGSTHTITVTSNVAWTASASPDFVTLDPSSGTKDDKSITVTIPANTGETRSATITVSAEGADPKTVAVSQPGLTPALTVDQTALAFEAGDLTERSITLVTNVPWAATVAYSPEADGWLTVTPLSGTASEYLAISAATNLGNARSATITISASGTEVTVQPVTITVTQTQARIEASESSIEANENGSIRNISMEPRVYYIPDTLTVTANIEWAVEVTTNPNDNPTLAPAHTDPHEWISARADGNFLIYTIDANPYPRTRAATITITSAKEPIQIPVTQAARTHMYVGGSVVSVWDGPDVPAFTETSSGVYEITQAFPSGVFKLPLKNHYPTAFFAAGTADEVITPDGEGNNLYLAPLSIGWGSGEVDLKWKIETAGYYKLTVNLNTMKVSLQSETLPLEPGEAFIAGKIWSEFNVDAPGNFVSSPDSVGKYYQFLGTVGYTANETWPGANGAHEPIDIMWNSDTWPNPCPEGWTMPESGDLEALAETGFTWRVAGESGYTQNGVFFGPNHATATKADPQGTIFIPAGGHRAPADGALTDLGAKAIVHSANPMWGVSSQMFSFPTGYHALAYDHPEYYWYQIATEDSSTFNWGAGANVRCIKK
jgi:hypothetical protein